MRIGVQILLSFALAIYAASTLRAAEPSVLLTSKVATDGDFLTVPVQIEGKRCSFVVDTGAPVTALHTSFLDQLTRFDESEEPQELRPGLWSVQYHAPAMTVMGTVGGAIPFACPTIWCIDLTEIQEASDQQIDGVLGMDFLERYALDLDLAAGLLRLIDSKSIEVAPHDGVLAIDMVGRKPCIQIRSYKAEFWALIDTGALGTLDLQPEVHQALVEHDRLRRLPFEVEIEGEMKLVGSDQGWINELRVGPFQHHWLQVDSARLVSLLGLGYWSRYHVTFDFPRKQVSMNKGPRYGMFDCSGHSGLYIATDKNDPKVKTVAYIVKGCFSERNGIRVGDVLLAIDGTSVKDSSPHNIHRRLSQRFKSPCELRLQRDDKEFVVTLPQIDEGTVPFVEVK